MVMNFGLSIQGNSSNYGNLLGPSSLMSCRSTSTASRDRSVTGVVMLTGKSANNRTIVACIFIVI